LSRFVIDAKKNLLWSFAAWNEKSNVAQGISNELQSFFVALFLPFFFVLAVSHQLCLKCVATEAVVSVFHHIE
jgi:hypothetical protein